MNYEDRRRIRRDYLEWSGGFPPETQEDVQLYVEVASSRDDDDADVIQVLNEWMNAPDSCD